MQTASFGRLLFVNQLLFYYACCITFISMKNIINEILPINQLTQYEKNSRTHSDEQIQSLAAAIDKFGFTQPIICDENKVILAGHGRYMAAMELGLELVPFRIV